MNIILFIAAGLAVLWLAKVVWVIIEMIRDLFPQTSFAAWLNHFFHSFTNNDRKHQVH